MNCDAIKPLADNTTPGLWQEALEEALRYAKMALPKRQFDDHEIMSNKLFFLRILFGELKERNLLTNKQKSIMQKKLREMAYQLILNDPRYKYNEKIKKDIKLLCLNNSLYWMGLKVSIRSFDG